MPQLCQINSYTSPRLLNRYISSSSVVLWNIYKYTNNYMLHYYYEIFSHDGTNNIYHHAEIQLLCRFRTEWLSWGKYQMIDCMKFIWFSSPNFTSHSIGVINMLPKIKHVQHLPYIYLLIFSLRHEEWFSKLITEGIWHNC